MANPMVVLKADKWESTKAVAMAKWKAVCWVARSVEHWVDTKAPTKVDNLATNLVVYWGVNWAVALGIQKAVHSAVSTVVQMEQRWAALKAAKTGMRTADLSVSRKAVLWGEPRAGSTV
jgi:uncharacterized membrane protein YGL010W